MQLHATLVKTSKNISNAQNMKNIQMQNKCKHWFETQTAKLNKQLKQCELAKETKHHTYIKQCKNIQEHSANVKMQTTCKALQDISKTYRKHVKHAKGQEQQS